MNNRDNLQAAIRDNQNAWFAYDWAQGLVWYADNELSLSIVQPVDYGVLEDMLAAFERHYEDTYAEMEWFEESLSSFRNVRAA